MGFKFCSVASGSSGNCIYIASDGCRLLIDAGVPLKRIEASLHALGVSGEQIDGVLVTHSHGDHIGGVPAFVRKYGTQVYCHTDTCGTLYAKMGVTLQRKIARIDESDFFVKDITVSPFAVSHDVHCLGYSLYNAGGKISVATDLGHINSMVINRIAGSDIALIEANHDEQVLKNNPRYPDRLKARILSRSGHLSNASCGAAVAELARSGVKQVILGHLSENNNTPELALGTVKDILRGSLAELDNDVRVAVALQERMSAVYEINTAS